MFNVRANPRLSLDWSQYEYFQARDAITRTGQLQPNTMRAAASTIEALMYSLRKGTGALSRPDVLRRLGELDDRQMRDVIVRLQKFKPQIAPAWTPDQVAVLAAVRRKSHDR